MTRSLPVSFVIAMALMTATCSANPGPDGNSGPAVVIAGGLDTPWGLAFLPDGGILVTERKGTVRLITAGGQLQTEPVATISAAVEAGEGGLLGITLHPAFSSNNLVYLYYSYSATGQTLNRVVRMTYSGGRLTGEEVVLGGIPGASNHDGGRIKFGPDGFLYIGTGDAGVSSRSQDTGSLAGKILRVTDAGQPVPGNPFGSEVYSYGHRNVEGLAWGPNGALYATEHGSSAADEINRIEAGKNYGWPEIRGDETLPGMETPLRHSGSTTWAPSGAAFLNGSLFFGGLAGQALYEAVIQGGIVTEVKEHFKGQFGRVRDVVAGPDSRLYITTSNRDGRGNPSSNDDRIIRVDPSNLQNAGRLF